MIHIILSSIEYSSYSMQRNIPRLEKYYLYYIMCYTVHTTVDATFTPTCQKYWFFFLSLKFSSNTSTISRNYGESKTIGGDRRHL